MDKRKMKKLLILNLPYFLVGLFATNLGEAWRLAEGADSSAKILSFFNALPIALNNPLPSFHPLDLLIGILCGAGLRLAVYLKGKNAKKYRHNVEYGSARCDTARYKRKRRYHIRKYCHRCFGIGNNGRNADGNGFGSFAWLVPTILYRAGHDVRFGNHHLCDRLRSND